MKTFKRPARLILFFDPKDPASQDAHSELLEAQSLFDDVYGLVAALDINYHKALKVAFQIEAVPLMLILDQNGELLIRESRPEVFNRECFAAHIDTIASYEHYEEAGL